MVVDDVEAAADGADAPDSPAWTMASRCLEEMVGTVSLRSMPSSVGSQSGVGVVGATENGHVVAAFDEPGADLFDVMLDAAVRCGHAPLTHHGNTKRPALMPAPPPEAR